MKIQLPDYQLLAQHYENCLIKHGATPKGVDWPNAKDANKRLQIMLELFEKKINQAHLSILDLGCGYGAFYDFLDQNNYLNNLQYTGIDLSKKMIQTASTLHPHVNFETRDIIQSPLQNESFDFIVMNGVLTEKTSLSWNNMRLFAQTLIKNAYQACRQGIAFNVMSNHVDWCRLDLFHWGLDDLIFFLKETCSRNFVIRSDYQLYEYTVYVYRTAFH